MVPSSVTKTDQLGRLIDLAAEAIGLTREGKRTPEEVSRILLSLQEFKERKASVAVYEMEKKFQKWQRFYKKYFNRTIDLSSLVIPQKQEGFDRLLVIAKGITMNQAYAACAEQFPVWRYNDDFDKTVPHNDRMPTETYAIWGKDRIEADEELANLSANTLKERGINGETLLERLIHELKYYDETGKHLDLLNRTLCQGSRDAGGFVPYVFWIGDKLEIDWCSPDGSDDGLRARQVVS